MKCRWLEPVRAVSWLDAMKVTFSFLVVIALIAWPTYIVAEKSQFHNPLTQVLFDLLLLAASLWFGVTYSNREAEKNATGKWLPAAETACNELLTMSATTERMYLEQAKVCESIVALFPDIPAGQLATLKYVVEMRCEEYANNLENLKNHIENSYRNWQVFVESNCDEGECECIRARLEDRRRALDMSIARDFSEVASQGTA